MWTSVSNSVLFFYLYRVDHKNVPNFAMMLYYSTIEFKQKEITFFLKQSELTNMKIMTLDAFVFTVKYATECIGCLHKITSNLTRLTAREWYPVTAISEKSAESRLHSAF